jgi:mannose-1-phosphate guanylyltransferase / phosphomannomutase
VKAVIMAGGEGTRLRPQTSNLPKPMLPLVGRPMMEHIVSLLRRHGITDIVVTVAFLPNAIRSYFGDGSELGVRMVYATEESPLGTAGSVRNAREQLTERFLVISGDVLTDIDLSAVIDFHEENAALATLALCAVENPLEFGIVITREDHRALPREARMGPGLLRHHQHGNLRSRTRDLRPHPRGARGGLLR